MTPEQANKLVRRLLAGYPNLGAHDPEGYISALNQVMGEYPLWAGQRTILKVDDENSQFPPTERTVRKWLDDAVSPYRFAAEWNARSAKQIEERKQIEASTEPQQDAPAVQRGQTYSNFTEAVADHGRPDGVFESGRQISYRG